MINFQVTEEHMRRQRRKALYWMLFLILACTSLLAKAVNADQIKDLFFPLLGLAIFAPMILSNYRHIKEGAAAYPSLNLNEPERKVAVLHKDLKVLVDLSQIKNLRLQRKSDRLVSILIKTSSGEDLRFEGYENLDMLAAALERLTPKENITYASFYHR